MNNMPEEEQETFRVLDRVTDCLFLAGPTGSGKTRLAIELAHRLDAEIISLDSMAIYRFMDIGTAKPTLQERDGIPHYMIDIVDPWQEFSLAAYVTQSRELVQKIHEQGKRVLFVGGTPLYLKGMLRGIFDGPGADPVFREQMEKEENGQPGFLFSRLTQVDPVTANRLHPNDRRRLIRALEVHEKTGIPISCFQKQFDRPASWSDAKVFVLDWDRELLYNRINRRVDLMMAAGFEQEARYVLSLENPPGKTASQAVGYRELFAYFRGELSYDEAVERTKQYSRNFAKSQGTWFRSLPECHYVPMTEETPLQETVDVICHMIELPEA